MHETEKFRKGDVIIQEGSTGSVAYVVKSGQVEVSKQVEGEKIVLSVLGPGSILGEMGLVDDKPRSATVVALEDTEMKVITRDRFVSMLEKNPQGMIPLLKQVFSRVRYLNQMVAAFCVSVDTAMMDLRPARLILRPVTREARRALNEEEVEIAKMPFQMGRATRQSIFGSNDLNLHDLEPYRISRCHCLLTIVNNEYHLIDSVSSTGTVVDGIRIGGREERKSMVLKEGKHTLVLGGEESPYLFELEILTIPGERTGKQVER